MIADTPLYLRGSWRTKHWLSLPRCFLCCFNLLLGFSRVSFSSSVLSLEEELFNCKQSWGFLCLLLAFPFLCEGGKASSSYPSSSYVAPNPFLAVVKSTMSLIFFFKSMKKFLTIIEGIYTISKVALSSLFTKLCILSMHLCHIVHHLVTLHQLCK